MISSLYLLSFSILSYCTLRVLPVFRPILLNRMAKRRHRSLCNSELPPRLEQLRMLLATGLDLQLCLKELAEERSAIGGEFRILVQDLELGLGYEAATAKFQDKLNDKTATLFCNTLVQCQKMGSDLASSLSLLVEEMNTRRFQLAEERAGKISVKMMIPMLVFVLPATMIIMMGPLFIEWMEILK